MSSIGAPTRAWSPSRGASRHGELTRFLLVRVANGALIILGAVIISFFLVNVSGNPGDALGSSLGPEAREAFAHKLGYDQPLEDRFTHYLGGVVQGDFGESYRSHAPALETVMDALPNTLILVATAMLLALFVSVPIVVRGAIRRGDAVDRTLRTTLVVLQGVPDFWLALLLTLIFSVQLQLLPSIGFDGADSLILPVIALAVPLCPVLVRIFRGEVLDVMDQEFVTALRAKGISELRLVVRHALPNAAGPFVTLVALQAGLLLGGTLLVEVVFGWPGIGNALFTAVNTRDLAVVQCIVVMIAIGYVVLNLVADLAVLWLDPRTRRARA